MLKSFRLGDAVEQAESKPEEVVVEQTGVDSIIGAHDTVVFISSTCPYCTKALAELDAAGIPYHAVERTAEMRAELLSKTGATSVPSGWVKGTYIGGCNDGPEAWMGILPCIHSGKIQELLGQ